MFCSNLGFFNTGNTPASGGRRLTAGAAIAFFILAGAVQAQNQIQCQTNTGAPPVVRVEGYAEPVGDLFLACSGGVPTAAGQTVPSVNITVSLNSNLTSRLLGFAGWFSEALLIIDDPYSPGPHAARPVLNCGAPGAPDASPFDPGVCAIVSTGDPAQTYDGAAGVRNTAPCARGLGCGRPNVFQGRRSFNFGGANAIEFVRVPFDPPGTGTSRTLRITNVRADAESIGVSSSFSASAVSMNISVSGNPGIVINYPTQTVGFVQKSLTSGVVNPRLDFTRCGAENGKLFAGTPSSFINLPNCSADKCGGPDGGGNNGGSGSAMVRFSEGFTTAWKPRNLSETVANGTFTGILYAYNGGTHYPPDLNQNVPGTTNYLSETGFNYTSTAATPVPNPPLGIGIGPVSAAANLQAFSNADTGMNRAGVATQGTRVAVSFDNIPAGVKIFVPPVIYLYRLGTTQVNGPTTFEPGPPIWDSRATGSSGVMVLTTTALDGSGPFTPASSLTDLQQVHLFGDRGVAVYEILSSDPYSLEGADVPVVAAWDSPSSPGFFSRTTGTATVTAGYAPFHNSFFDRWPSPVLPTPRFVGSQSSADLFKINRCQP